MSKFWNRNLRTLKPYVSGEQPNDKKYIKLNANENPYPPSSQVITQICELANEDLRLYPDPDSTILVNAISDYYTVSRDKIFVGNGSDEILAFCFLAYFEKEKPILFPDITFAFYKVFSAMFDIPYKLIPLNNDFTIPVAEFLKDNGGILIANPNATTGIALGLHDIETILSKNENSVVIVDEAYVDFGAQSALPLIDKYPNLLVVQTMSKSRCLAGLRVGFAIGSKELIDALNIVKNSFNSYTMDRLALAGGTQAVLDRDYFTFTNQKIQNTRQRIVLELTKLGFALTPSISNFLLITHPSFNAKELFDYLRENGILVRYFNSPRIDNFLRVTIGKDKDMDIFIDVLKRRILS